MPRISENPAEPADSKPAGSRKPKTTRRRKPEDLPKIDAYERKHANRKTVHEKVESLTS